MQGQTLKVGHEAADLALTLSSELGVIDLRVAKPLASVCGSVELRFSMPNDVQGFALAFGPKYGEQLLLL